MRGRSRLPVAVAKGPQTMETARDQRGTTDPRTSGVNQPPALGTLDSQALVFKLQLKERRSTLRKRIKLNSMVSVCAIAVLLVVILLLELQIRTLTNHSMSRRQQLEELRQIRGRDSESALSLNRRCLL